MEGTFIDKYEVLQKLGEGGMATVYRGRHTALAREVAIKVLHPHLSASVRNRQRFAREARAIEHLDHDNILKIFDFSGHDTDDIYIVTEFVDGHTLRELLDARGLVSSEVAAMIGAELAAALAYAHRAGIIHRDLKPENVMLRRDGAVKLMDFGIARFLDESTVTMTGALVGSPAYMSPEQAMERVLDARSDLFSLGTLLFQLVTGQLPFAGSNPSVILRKIIDGTRPDVLALQPGVSPRLADMIDDLLNTSPDDRPERAEKVRDELLLVLDDVGLSLDQPTWSLATYLHDPSAYESRLSDWLDETLLESGRAALSGGAHLEAQRVFNRLLARDPEREDVLVLLADVHQQVPLEEAPTHHAQSWLGAIALVVLAALGWWWLAPRAEPPRGHTAAEAALQLQESELAEPAPLTAPPLPAPESFETVLVESIPRPATRTSKIPSDEPGARPIAARAATPRPQRSASGTGSAAAPSTAAPSTDAPSSQAPGEQVGSAEADEPGTIVLRLGQATWAQVLIDGESRGTVPPTFQYEVAPGEHVLVLRNRYAEDHEQVFTVEPGGRFTVAPITLRRKPVTVRFAETVDAACELETSSGAAGTVGSSGGSIEVYEQDGRRLVSMSCPDGASSVFDLSSRKPGTTVTLPEGP